MEACTASESEHGMLLVKKNDRTLGVANYIDEAQGFAERLEGPKGVVDWSPTGEMFVDGELTGWRIWSVQRIVAEEHRPL